MVGGVWDVGRLDLWVEYTAPRIPQNFFRTVQMEV